MTDLLTNSVTILFLNLIARNNLKALNVYHVVEKVILYSKDLKNN